MAIGFDVGHGRATWPHHRPTVPPGTSSSVIGLPCLSGPLPARHTAQDLLFGHRPQCQHGEGHAGLTTHRGPPPWLSASILASHVSPAHHRPVIAPRTSSLAITSALASGGPHKLIIDVPPRPGPPPQTLTLVPALRLLPDCHRTWEGHDGIVVGPLSRPGPPLQPRP